MSITRHGTIGAVAAALLLGAGAGPVQAADEVVLHSTTTTTYEGLGTVSSEAWADEATGDAVAVHFDEAGERTAATAVDAERIRWVLYGDRAFVDDAAPTGPAAPETTAASLRRLHAAGRLVANGHETVGGRRALVLATADTHRQHRERFWVDEATYVPLRSEARGRYAVSRTRYEALPRTAESLARVSLTVPAGFRRLASLPPSFTGMPAGRPARTARATRVLSKRRRAAARHRRAKR